MSERSSIVSAGEVYGSSVLPAHLRRSCCLPAYRLECGTQAQTASDPLPSWNEGGVKKSITEFVTRVTTRGQRDLVPLKSASPPSTTTARCGPSSRYTSSFSSQSTA